MCCPRIWKIFYPENFCCPPRILSNLLPKWPQGSYNQFEPQKARRSRRWMGEEPIFVLKVLVSRILQNQAQIRNLIIPPAHVMLTWRVMSQNDGKTSSFVMVPIEANRRHHRRRNEAPKLVAPEKRDFTFHKVVRNLSEAITFAQMVGFFFWKLHEQWEVELYNPG